MGTRGLIGYIYKGQKYVKYNHSDSYPHGLGMELLLSIPTDPEAFQRWLEETRALLEAVEEEVIEGGDPHPYVLSRTSRPIRIEGQLEWIYVFDLDLLTFTVNDSLYFRLDKLPPPDEWMGYLAIDGSHDLCVAPWMPEQYRAELIAHPVKALSDSERKDMEYYDDFTCGIEKILPSAWSTPAPQHLAVSEKLALLAAEGFITARYAQIRGIHRHFISRVNFEDLAMDLLTAACHGGSAFTFSDQTARTWLCDVLHKPMYGRKRIDYFWFRDRLVSLVRTLEDAELFKAEVGIILRWMKEKGLGELTSILWSVHHVAVLVVSGDKISHSDPIPVAAALGRGREEMTVGLKLIMHYLPLRATEGNPLFSCRLPLDIVLRIMELSDTRTTATLGRTSKALRYEWVRHPYCGPYQLLSVQGDHFLAIDRISRYISVKLEPLECSPYDHEASHGFFYQGHGPKGLVAYRRPLCYVADYNCRLRGAVHVEDFSRIHGYQVFVTLQRTSHPSSL